MARATKKLDDLAALLEKTGGDPRRLEAVKRAQNFRRSWIDLAKVLAEVKKKKQYSRWGYADFYEYCDEELTLKRGTVDKLTISFRTLEKHAPQVLSRDGVAKTIPSYEAIDYYSKAAGPIDIDEEDLGEDDAEDVVVVERPRVSAPPQLEELSTAVFDEGKPLAELRKQFDPVFFPKPKGVEKLAVLNKASAAARKLAELLPDIDGLEEAQVRKLETELGKLRTRLDELAEPMKEKVAKARAKQRAAASGPRTAPRKKSAANE